MDATVTSSYTVFAGTHRITSGTLADVAAAARRALDAGSQEPILIFDDETARVVDVDLRGTPEDIAERFGGARNGEGADGSSPYRETLTPRGRGRPKLGVVAREVTLLPRHWEWLASQPGGASAAVRRLVDAARQTSVDKDRSRAAKEIAYRFMSAMAGNEPGFEEATRALFANNAARFVEMTASWPRDVRDYARRLAERAF
jgi:uncharacterized protein